MTWVIGAASIFSTGTIISDVKVRFADGHTADMLQKAYPVGNYIAAGFAGSVCIGFQLIESLRNTLFVPGNDENYAFDPAQIVHEWASTAREIFQHAPEEEKKLGAQIVLVGISPVEHMGVPEFPRVYVIRFTAPHFEPGFMDKGLRMCSIGSGARVKEYKRALRPLFRGSSGIHNTHTGGVYGWAKTLAFFTTHAVRNFPYAGISENFHIVGVRLGEMAVVTNNMTIHPPGKAPIELIMPTVARSWQEFCEMAETQATIFAGATC